MIRPWRFAAALAIILAGAIVGIRWSVPGTVNGASILMVALFILGLWLGMRSPRSTATSDVELEEGAPRGR